MVLGGWATEASGTTTTTTLPTGQLVAGKKLLLKDDPAKPEKRRLVLLLKDRDADLGDGNGSADDPTLAGGELRVVSRAGDGFVGIYPLPAGSWSYKGKAGKNKGYKFKGDGPIRKILVKAGKLVKITGKGAELVFSLGADPTPVHVSLSLGGHRYCATFDGTPKFTAGKKYLVKKTAAPGACLALVPECGDGILDPGEQCPLLEGPGDGPALDATFDLVTGEGVPDDEVSLDGDGLPIARTQVEIAFDPTATVSAVNAVVTSISGRIVSMLEDVLVLLVAIPDPGDLANLDAVVASLEANPIVRYVNRATFDEPADLPANYMPGSADLPKIDNQLAVRAPAAWSARAALPSSVLTRPLVVVGDFFGGGAPDARTDVIDIDADYGSGALNAHGYHVLGIIAALWGGDTSTAGLATGIMPSTSNVRTVDNVTGPMSKLSTPQFENDMLQRVRAHAGPVVLNTSVQFRCKTAAQVTANCNATTAAKRALTWIEKVRGTMGIFGGTPSLEGRFLHLAAGGNVSVPGDTDATVATAYAAARLLQPIYDMPLIGDPSLVPNLTNVLVVENVINSTSEPFRPTCLNDNSKRPGEIAGIGTDVYSLTAPMGAAGNLTGTSFATPQVAGLAAWVWSLDPSLTPQDLAELLQITARDEPQLVDPRCTSDVPKPVIDAYAAVLSADRNLTDAPVRRAILDVVDASGALGTNGRFDERDLERFLTEFDAAAGALDYSRFDLNGDGRTGGDETDRVDLDVNRPPEWTMVDRPDGLGDPYDERAVTDLDVLCYYAHSPLYVGSTDDRAALLAGRPCPILKLAASLASTITPGTPEPLLVSVGEEDDMGSRPVENAYVELTATGGSVAPTSGTTDARGELTAQVSVDTTASAVEVLVRVLTRPGGTEMGRTTVTALSTMPPLADECGVSLDVGVHSAQTAQLGPLMDTATDGPVTVMGSVEIGRTALEVHYDVDEVWSFDGGAETIWTDVIEVRAVDPNDSVAKMRHRMRFTIASNVNNRSFPEDSQGWFELDSDGFNPGGTIGFNERNLGGDRPQRVEEIVYERAAGPHTTLRIRTRLSTFTGFGGQAIDATVDGTAVIEWLGIDQVLDFDGNPIPFTYRSLCGGLIGTTTSTTTSTSTSSTSSSTTSTSTTTSTTPPTGTSTSSTSTSTSTTTSTAPGGGGSYRLYDATGQDAPMVALEDQIRMESVDLGSVVHLLVPVSIDGSLVVDATAYETCYAYPGASFTGTAQVSNIFGGQTLTVGDPAALCTPESVTLTPLDDFACYAATGATVGQIAFLDDGLTAESVTVGAPTLLCLPTRVDGDPLVSPAGALVCYDTPTTGSAPGSVAVDNRFGMDTLGVGLPSGACISSIVTSVVAGP